MLCKAPASLLRPPTARALSSSLPRQRRTPSAQRPPTGPQRPAVENRVNPLVGGQLIVPEPREAPGIRQAKASKPAPVPYHPTQEWWNMPSDDKQPSAGTVSGKPVSVKDQIPLFPSSPDLPPGPPPASLSADKTQDPTPSSTPEHTYDANLKDPAQIAAFCEQEYKLSSPQSLDPRQYPRVHTRPVTGRTVFVLPGRIGPNTALNVPSAFRVLAKLVRDIGLKFKSKEQKKHLRPGLKKKMLRSRRFRERFRLGFKAATSRALELKKQGW
ncbi:hypothetical protein CDD80_2613 [Ophiocordyceps camponoti-rufipedis]|uniref:Ribosomal protein S21 n=1 Tax=Ophiocordyceps camponoti-rufipedis TaxID=2004952 RepID=A0A2C5Z5J6_9HYPO|nr:hypothetical protein CDD80_2613 [Ophiocordyceps camponoti-rufipedis]